MFKEIEDAHGTPYSRLCSVDTNRARKLLSDVQNCAINILESSGHEATISVSRSWFADTVHSLLEGYDVLLRLIEAVSMPDDRDAGRLESAARNYLSAQTFHEMERVHFRPEFEYVLGVPASHPVVVLSSDPREILAHGNGNTNPETDVLCGTFLHGNFRVLPLDRRWLVRESSASMEVSNTTPQ